MFSFLSTEPFFRSRLPAGLLTANAACFIFLVGFVVAQSDVREGAYYVAGGPSIFLAGGAIALLALALGQLKLKAGYPLEPVRWAAAFTATALSALILVCGLVTADLILRSLATGELPTFECRMAQARGVNLPECVRLGPTSAT